MISKLRGLYHRAVRRWAAWRISRQVDRVEAYLVGGGNVRREAASPVLFFNASTRIHMLSLNGAFSLLASWGLRARGVPVEYIVCHRGMEQCILGTNREDYSEPPPCEPCIQFSQRLFPEQHIHRLELHGPAAAAVGNLLAGRSMKELAAWEYAGYPLGELTLPGLQWALRRKDLPDDERTRSLFRRYLCSAASLVERFENLFEELEPAAIVLFNGITYPEAVAGAVAEQRDLPVVTHEVGLRSMSAFFSHDHATFREVPVPDDFELTPAQEQELDTYLQDRRAGRFTMAGVRFWPQMAGLPAVLRVGLEKYEKRVAVFTNVIFDTSQVHANTLFTDMFDWLNSLVATIKDHPETLFVLRAHPDEDRPGKRSEQSVADWYDASEVRELPNVLFFAPSEYVSSYQLIEAVDLVLVYNSSIGLEASIMGRPVISAGRARFTQADTVTLPETREGYERELRAALEAPGTPAPRQHQENARRFLYRELHAASLDFSAYLEPYPSTPGMVRFGDFDPAMLAVDPVLDRIHQGIVHGEPFVAEVGT